MISAKEAFNKLRPNLIKAWRAPKDWISKSSLTAGTLWYIIDLPFPDMSGETALISSMAFVISRSIHLANKADLARNNKLQTAFKIAQNEDERIKAIEAYGLDAFKWGRFVPHYIAKRAQNISVKAQRERSVDDWADGEVWVRFNDIMNNPQATLQAMSEENTSKNIRAGSETLSISGSQYSYSIEYNKPEKSKLLGFIPLPN